MRAASDGEENRKGSSLQKDGGLLSGLRVLELGHFVAAPFCTRLLGDLGADVIKVEPPSGDPVRQWGAQINGRSLWWSIHGRNKRCISLNLKHEGARQAVLKLVAQCDVVVENFRPGHLARLGLSEEIFKSVRPDLVIARISGFGQDGPYRDRAAFGVIGEAMGGLRYLMDHPAGVSNLPPVRAGISIGDSIAGLYAAFGVMAALWKRDRGHGGEGMAVDVALTEAVLSLMEDMLPEYGVLGRVKQPAGARISTAAPTNAYRTADDRWILIAANSDQLFARLARLMARPDLLEDLRFAGNLQRLSNVDVLDEAIEAWTSILPAAALQEKLEEADIPSTLIYSAAECAADPQFRFRGMVRDVADPMLGMVLHPGIVPHIPDSPGTIRWAGPEIGEHNEEILGDILGLSNSEIRALQAAGGRL